MHCAFCEARVGAHIRVTPVNSDGTEGQYVVVCNLVCLAQFAGRTAVRLGAEQVAHVTGAVASIFRSFRGPPAPPADAGTPRSTPIQRGPGVKP